MFQTIFKTTYKNLLKPILFRFDPEFTHDMFIKRGKMLSKSKLMRAITKNLFQFENPSLEQDILGLHFKNPVMLSAGFDKEADLMNILPSVGFGGMELGSITWKAYGGNTKPRLHRLKKSKAIIVNYGLKNLGAEATVKKIAKERIENKDFVFGVSIAKTNSEDTCELDTGVNDYFEGLRAFVESDLGDFYTINISCPNTFGGEPFTVPEKLDPLLKKLTTLNIKKPVFVKMPINLPWNEFEKLLDVVVKYKVPGVVIGNLNKDRARKEIVDEIPETIPGGISGKPTFELSNDLIEKTYQKYGKKLVIIGTGGIFSAEDAYEKIKRGASAVQLITGMIFEGPQLIGEINRGLVKLLENEGYKNISQAVGSGR